MTQRDDLITIVTVVYNGKLFIEDTITSILNQTYPHIEYIIIDGGSTDGTLDIINKYNDRISFWSSEPDQGVYDAMNKGIEKASGRWINFMNAGDFFYSNQSIEDLFSTSIDIDKYDTIYGDAQFRLKNIAYIVKSKEEVTSNEFMPFSHQAAFVKTIIAKATRFNLAYKIAADTAFFLRLVKESRQMKRIPIIVCSYDALQGLSADNEIKRSKELIDMQVELNSADINSSYFKKYIRNAYIKQYLRTLIPNCFWIKIREKSIKKMNEYTYINNG